MQQAGEDDLDEEDCESDDSSGGQRPQSPGEFHPPPRANCSSFDMKAPYVLEFRTIRRAVNSVWIARFCIKQELVRSSMG